MKGCRAPCQALCKSWRGEAAASSELEGPALQIAPWGGTHLSSSGHETASFWGLKARGRGMNPHRASGRWPRSSLRGGSDPKHCTHSRFPIAGRAASHLTFLTSCLCCAEVLLLKETSCKTQGATAYGLHCFQEEGRWLGLSAITWRIHGGGQEGCGSAEPTLMLGKALLLALFVAGEFDR